MSVLVKKVKSGGFIFSLRGSKKLLITVKISVRGVWGRLGWFWLIEKLFVLAYFDVWKALQLSDVDNS